MLKTNIEKAVLAEIIKFGETGELTESRLIAFGVILETLRERDVKIADYRENGAEPLQWASLVANAETVTLDRDGFEVQMESNDWCARRSYDNPAYVSVKDMLDPNVFEKIDDERRDKIKFQKLKAAERKIPANRMVDAEVEKQEVIALFESWLEEYDKS